MTSTPNALSTIPPQSVQSPSYLTPRALPYHPYISAQQKQQHQSYTSTYTYTTSAFPGYPRPSFGQRKLTTTLWEDESTLCYQVDANGLCVARRQDNDMINGTKLLNVAGMSRGKRDGILKNEKGRVVVKVGAMHLKGVWITFARAKALASQFKIYDLLYPLFVDDPSALLYPASLHTSHVPSSPNTITGSSLQQMVPMSRGKK
ncbi:transcription regulator HTH, apses-type DNA-binding domain-containing protein [Phycomyces blakesleeanus]